MIKFGTSGFREIINENFNKENVSKIAYALTEIIKKDNIKNPKIVIGFDNRLQSKEMANLTAKIFSSKKIKVLLYKKSVPSPLVVYKTKTHTFGFMITASHNPYNYNGIKIFLNPGKECDDSFSKRIEDIANACNYEEIRKLEESYDEKYIAKTTDTKEYLNAIIKFIDKKNIKSRNLKILFNAMHGSSATCIKQISEKVGLTNYGIIHASADPYFNGQIPAPYKYNLTDQAKLVKKSYDLGIAFDSDGDRISVIDKSGEIYDCNFIFPVIYSDLIRKGKGGDIVKNSALSNLSKIIALKNNNACFEAKVGFKNIGQIFETTTAYIGAESNGIALKEHILSKDGLLVAFLLIDLLSIQTSTFKQILKGLQKEYNFKSNVVEHAYPITNEQKKIITKLLFEDKKLPKSKFKIVSISYKDGLKINYEDNYWGVFRFSGNENVIRLFTEMANLTECKRIISIYEKFIGLKTRQK